MSLTKLENLINPQVMSDMISAKLPAAIRFSGIAKIDNTLVGRAGNTITVPAYHYIGDAEDVAEGVAMGTSVLTASTTQATVKKIGKAVELTDEAVLSDYGDTVGESTSQIVKAISNKIDNDCLEALNDAQLEYDGLTETIGYEGVVKALDIFEEEDFNIPKLIFIHPHQLTTLRLDPDFKDINKFPQETMMTGVIGVIAGCQVVVSKKIKENELKTGYINYIVQCNHDKDDPAVLTIYMKKAIEIEKDRDILRNTTVISADEHYVSVLSNKSKVVKAIFKK